MVEGARRGRLVGSMLRGLSIVSIAGGAALCVNQLLPERGEAHAASSTQVSVAGERIALSSDARLNAERIADTYLSSNFVIRAGNRDHTTTRRALGVAVDTGHLAALLTAATDSSSPLRQVHARTLGDRPLSLPMPTDLDLTRATALLTRLKDLTDTPALEPRIEPRAKRVAPGRNGTELDVFTTLDRIDAALRVGATRVEAVVRTVTPRESKQALEEIELPAILGEFDTRYNRTSLSEDRTHNLRVAATKLDGFVLQPGEVFDFNAAVGDRTETKGFRNAPVIADGELVDGMGGGTCQIASTLHAAVYFAGLPILTRFPHSRPSYYIKLGLDATVVYGAQNFRFQNDRPYPIVLGLSVEDGRVHATLHGRARDHSVIFMRHIDAVIPFEERTITDRNLPSGLRVLDQRGIPGFKITRIRVIHDPATQTDVRERSNDTYPPTAQVWRVGTGGEAPPNFAWPKNDPHPEYVADEFLQMTQTEKGTVDTIREAGQTGSYGWIERAGLVLRKP